MWCLRGFTDESEDIVSATARTRQLTSTVRSLCTDRRRLQRGRYMLVPCRPGTPTYKLQVKTGSEVCTHALPRALQYWTLPPSQGGL
jgi:hypothetical protein